MSPADTVIILDFETTGLSPDMGDRAIEIGAVRVECGEITERFQSLMNPGRRVTAFIEEYTGITNAMLKEAPPCEDVLAQFADFIDGFNLVAHNASFDKRFLDAEFHRLGKQYSGQFACSLLVSRRIYQEAPNHKLGTLVQYADISSHGIYHRALFDAEMTAKLWLAMLNEIEVRYHRKNLTFVEMQQLGKVSKRAVSRYFLAK